MQLSASARGLASRIRPHSRRDYVITVAAVVILVGGLGYLVFGRGSSSASATTTTQTVTTGTFSTSVSGSGTIEPATEADLDFGVSGTVTSVKVKAGDTVSKGDVLATLDTVSLKAALATAEAQLDAAETTAADDGSSSSTQQASNDAAVESAEADVTTAKANLADAKLTSTITGTVADVGVAVGDSVSGGSSSSSSSSSSSTGSSSGSTGGSGGSSTSSSSTSTTSTTSAAVTVVTPKKFEVDVDVSADDVKQVKKGLQVQITPSGATTAIFGTVKSVGLVAETSSSGTATFPVVVSITGSQSDLYAGTTATVSIIVKQETNVLTVPTAALTTTAGKTYVEKVSGSSVKKTEVTVGQTYGASTEITKGLASGDKIQVTTTRTFGGGANRTGGTEGGGTEGGAGGFGGAPGGGTGGFGGGFGGGN